MKSSEMLDRLLPVLNNAQKELPVIKEEGYNPFHKSRYVELDSLVEIIKEVFRNHDLMVMQFPSYEAGVVFVETTIFHVESGQWISCNAGTPATESAQGTGSAITYLRRYGLMCMGFLATEDDDAETADGRGKKDKAKTEPESDYLILKDLIAQKKVPIETQTTWLERADVATLEDLNQKQMTALINKLRG